MLTIVDAPIILYVVQEAVKAGIEDIILISGRQKHSIEDFFDCSYELEDTLEKNGKSDLLKIAKDVRNMANIISVRQKSALGLGHAILCSQPIVGNDPFAVLLGDEIMLEDSNCKTAIAQLCDIYLKQNVSAVAVMEVSEAETSKYGIVEVNDPSATIMQVKKIIEKPKLGQTKSRLALPGRYVFDSKIYENLRNQMPGVGNEIQLSDSMQMLSQNSGLVASKILNNTRYDAGDKLGFIQANIEIALKNPELRDSLKSYLLKLTSDKLSTF